MLNRNNFKKLSMKLTEENKKRIEDYFIELKDEESNYLMETYFERNKKALTIPVVVRVLVCVN